MSAFDCIRKRHTMSLNNCSEFFDHSMHLNSMVWACGVTGKTNLTYEEALKSERDAGALVDAFPSSLERPLVYLTTVTYRGRLDDVVNH